MVHDCFDTVFFVIAHPSNRYLDSGRPLGLCLYKFLDVGYELVGFFFRHGVIQGYTDTYEKMRRSVFEFSVVFSVAHSPPTDLVRSKQTQDQEINATQ